MVLFSDRFMAKFVQEAQRAAREADGIARELQMVVLTANTLARLATSESLDEGEQKQAAMLAVRLMANLELDFASWMWVTAALQRDR